MMNLKKNSKGFTLIELVVVLVIIGILAVIAVPSYRNYTRRAMAAEGNALLGAILSAQKAYFTEANRYLAQPATSNSAALGVDARGNKYFTSFTITVNGLTGDNASFTATTAGTGDAAGIAVTMTATPIAAPVTTTAGL
ncbi:MAG: prepilin-type N-terminal cleavage/methylation domain-containing protein [Elusimicrobiota bacterium]